MVATNDLKMNDDKREEEQAKADTEFALKMLACKFSQLSLKVTLRVVKGSSSYY